MIELRNIVKEYNTENMVTRALDGLDLTLDNGEYVAVMGRSGSGKSTLLHILGGMDRATSGQYLWDGREISGLDAKELEKFRKEHVSFVFQNYMLMNSYTVFENIEVPLIARGVKAKQRKETVEKYMELVGISDLAGKLPIHISGGQQQRCGIARALAADTDLLLADEPTGALDRKTGEEIMDVFDRIKGERTIVLVTHDENIASRTDRILHIEDGKLMR